MSYNEIFLPAIDSQFKSYWPILGVHLCLIVIGLLLKWRGRIKLLRRVANTFIYFGVVGIVIYIFRYERVLYFDSPILIYLLGISFVGAVLWIIVNHIIQTPKMKQQQLKEQIKSKYLPKQKNNERK